MKVLKFIAVLLLVAFTACKNQEKKTTVEPEVIKETETSKTYAEISIKEGGHWEGRIYKDGTFKNYKA